MGHAVRRFVIGLGLIVVWSGSAFAQSPLPAPKTPVQTFDALVGVVSVDEDILVTDVDHRTIKGRVVSVSGSSLTIQARATPDNPGGAWSYRPTDVTRIRKPDSIVDGLLIGLAAGAGAMVAFTAGNCSHDAECAAITNAIGLAVFVPAGAITGALIDKFHVRTLFTAPTSAPMITVAPMLRRDARGVVLALKF